MKAFHGFLVLFTALLLTGLSACTEEDPSPSPSDPRTALVGDWSVIDQEYKQAYEVTIQLDGSSTTRIRIINFANSGIDGNPAVAEVSGTNIYLVSEQMIGDGWIVSGGGALVGSSTMNWTYQVNYDQADLKNYTAVYTKQ